jgi:hypothetical protein
MSLAIHPHPDRQGSYLAIAGVKIRVRGSACWTKSLILPKGATIGSYFHVVSTFVLPPLQGASLWWTVPRVETLGLGLAGSMIKASIAVAQIGGVPPAEHGPLDNVFKARLSA